MRKWQHTSWLLLLALFYFLTYSHASSSLWELNLARFSRISTISSKHNITTPLATLQSTKNESFSLILLWDFSTLSWHASIVKVASSSHLCTSRALSLSFHSATPICTPICTLHLQENENLVLKQGTSLVLWESHMCSLYVNSLKILDHDMLIDLKGQANHMILQSLRARKLNFPRRALQESSSNSPISDNGSSNSSPSNNGSGGHRNKKALAMEIVFPVAAFLLLAFCLAFLFSRRRKAKKPNQISIDAAQKSRRVQEDEVLLETLAPGLPPRFTYAEMQEATNGFQKKLGEGGYGAVYEGILPSTGSKIAVKVFLDTASTACRKGFCAEVMSIGERKHSNLVQLRGFCVEDDHRMLVYELMENGSLNKVLFGGKAEGGMLVSWERRKEIAMDTARALAFLHEEGEQKTPVIHCDVKPENILLNENWVAKVSDFGLAKLLWAAKAHHEEEEEEDDDGKTHTPSPFPSIDVSSRLSHLSGLKGVRGTLGYLAPEWIRADAGPDTITTASDVYSFGVVLLELVAGRRAMVPGHPFLLGHAFDMLAAGHDFSDLLDPCLHTTYPKGASIGALPSIELEDVRKSVNVALWCLQEDLNLRPTMVDVLKMLTNKEPIPTPPFCDYFAGSSHFFDEGESHDHHHLFSDTTSASHDKELQTSSQYTSHETSSWQTSILSGR